MHEVACDPGYMSRKIQKFRTDKFEACDKRKFVYMNCITQNIRLLHERIRSSRVGNISLRFVTLVAHERIRHLSDVGYNAIKPTFYCPICP